MDCLFLSRCLCITDGQPVLGGESGAFQHQSVEAKVLADMPCQFGCSDCSEDHLGLQELSAGDVFDCTRFK